MQGPRSTSRCPCFIKRPKPQEATRNHCQALRWWTCLSSIKPSSFVTHNKSGIHSPSTFYSSCTFGNRLNTYSYHSCLYPNISVMHQFPDKRKGSNNTVINSIPFQPVGAFKRGRMWVIGKLTSMHGFISRFLTFLAFLSIWICEEMDTKILGFIL